MSERGLAGGATGEAWEGVATECSITAEPNRNSRPLSSERVAGRWVTREKESAALESRHPTRCGASTLGGSVPGPSLQPDLFPQFPSVPLFRSATAFTRGLALGWLAGTHLMAQTVSTVRETEFRSRWADLQVDRPQLEVGPGIPLKDADEGFGSELAGSLRSIFRTGPVVFRVGMSAGIEYTSQQANVTFTDQPSTSSFFAAPVLAAFYDREVGPWTVSARYSVGYLYYFDRDYVAAGGSPGTPDQRVTVVVQPERTVQVRDPSRDRVVFNGPIRTVIPGFREERQPEITEEQIIPGQEARAPEEAIPSQSAGLDFRVTLSRLTVRSSGGAAFGSGFDTNRGTNQDRLTASEALSADYQLTEYTRAGVLLSGSYEKNTLPGSSSSDVFSRFGGSFYADYFITGKSRLRLEVSTGQDSRTFGSGFTEDRSYSQAQVRATLAATSKLALEASIGVGVTETTAASSNAQDGLRNVYSLTANYKPTGKIGARLYFGLEATATEPEFSFALNWLPRETTGFNLSAYQLSGASTLSFGQNRISRGFLASATQRLFQRGSLTLSGGWEQYEDVNTVQTSAQLEPYTFYGATFSYEFSRWLSLQALYRTASQSGSDTGAGGAEETRASLSLRLTF